MKVKLCNISDPNEPIVRGHAVVQISDGEDTVTMCLIDIVEDYGKLRVYINQPPHSPTHGAGFVFSVSEELEQKIVAVVLDAYHRRIEH
jgi:hypothetical protein